MVVSTDLYAYLFIAEWMVQEYLLSTHDGYPAREEVPQDPCMGRFCAPDPGDRSIRGRRGIVMRSPAGAAMQLWLKRSLVIERTGGGGVTRAAPQYVEDPHNFE